MSIFKDIEKNIQKNGSLSPNFQIERYKHTKNKQIIFAEGMEDFLIESKIDYKLLEFLKNMINLLKEDTLGFNANIVDNYFFNHIDTRVLGSIDTFLNWIRENRNKYDAQLIYRFGIYLTFGGNEIEAVKIGIALLTLFNYEPTERVIEDLEKLSLCEEFTMYTNVVFYNVSTGNDIRFRLVKKLKGYGKIALIPAIEIEDKMMEEWLLCYGCQNEVDNSFLGLTIAKKIDLPKIISENILTEDEFNGVYDIVTALLCENSKPGISFYEPKNKLFAAILLKYNLLKTNIKYYDLLIRIREYLKKYDKTNTIIKKINEILKREDTISFLKVMILNPDDIKVGINVITNLTNLDLSEEIYEVYHRNPKYYTSCIPYLMKNKKFQELVLKDWLEVMDLETYKGNPEPTIQLDDDIMELTTMIQILEDYPFVGTKIIIAGLTSRTMYPRNAAINTISIWKKKTKKDIKKFPKSLINAVQELRKKEVIKSYKERINSILEVQEDLSNFIEPIIYYSKNNDEINETQDENIQDKIHIFNGDIEVLFREIIAIRGEEYYSNGMVRQCVRTNDKYIAYVQGSQFGIEYEIVIGVDDESRIRFMHCNCPYEQNCKHEYATLLHIRSHYKDFVLNGK